MKLNERKIIAFINKILPTNVFISKWHSRHEQPEEGARVFVEQFGRNQTEAIYERGDYKSTATGTCLQHVTWWRY